METTLRLNRPHRLWAWIMDRMDFFSNIVIRLPHLTFTYDEPSALRYAGSKYEDAID